MSSPSAGFEAGEPAVLLVLRRFAEREGVTPLTDSPNAGNFRERDSSKKKEEQRGKRPSGFRLLHERLIAMCVVETTAATQSGMSSWKTKPCRVLLRLLAKPAMGAQGPSSARWSARAYVALLRVFSLRARDQAELCER